MIGGFRRPVSAQKISVPGNSRVSRRRRIDSPVLSTQSVANIRMQFQILNQLENHTESQVRYRSRFQLRNQRKRGCDSFNATPRNARAPTISVVAQAVDRSRHRGIGAAAAVGEILLHRLDHVIDALFARAAASAAGRPASAGDRTRSGACAAIFGTALRRSLVDRLLSLGFGFELRIMRRQRLDVGCPSDPSRTAPSPRPCARLPASG